MRNKSIDTICGPFDAGRYRKLKAAYDLAVSFNKNDFGFEGQRVLVKFAKYLLEFLAPHFAEEKKQSKMKARKMTVVLYDIMYDDKSTEVRSFTKMELAAWKRTNQYKKVISKKKLAEVSLTFKMPTK